MFTPTVPYEFLVRDLLWRYSAIPENLWQARPSGGFGLSPSADLISNIGERIGHWDNKDWQAVSATRQPPAELLQVVGTIIADATLQQAVASLLCIMGELMPPRNEL